MSFARFGKDSDIYFYCCDAETPTFECASCYLDESKDARPILLYGYDEAIEHIEKHKMAGHKVENDVIPLIEDMRSRHGK